MPAHRKTGGTTSDAPREAAFGRVRSPPEGVRQPCRCAASPAASFLPGEKRTRSLWVFITAPWYNSGKPTLGAHRYPTLSTQGDYKIVEYESVKLECMDGAHRAQSGQRYAHTIFKIGKLFAASQSIAATMPTEATPRSPRPRRSAPRSRSPNSRARRAPRGCARPRAGRRG